MKTTIYKLLPVYLLSIAWVLLLSNSRTAEYMHYAALFSALIIPVYIYFRVSTSISESIGIILIVPQAICYTNTNTNCSILENMPRYSFTAIVILLLLHLFFYLKNNNSVDFHFDKPFFVDSLKIVSCTFGLVIISVLLKNIIVVILGIIFFFMASSWYLTSIMKYNFFKSMGLLLILPYTFWLHSSLFIHDCKAEYYYSFLIAAGFVVYLVFYFSEKLIQLNFISWILLVSLFYGRINLSEKAKWFQIDGSSVMSIDNLRVIQIPSIKYFNSIK